MGKGDRKTRKGKINIRSYGNVRPHAAASSGEAKTAPARPAAKPAAVKKAPAKKAAAKKSA
jgi:30S ribosomal protein S31